MSRLVQAKHNACEGKVVIQVMREPSATLEHAAHTNKLRNTRSFFAFFLSLPRLAGRGKAGPVNISVAMY